MLVGHTDRQGNIKYWGVPGGLQDRSDHDDFRITAVREFLEEVMGEKSPSATNINSHMLLLNKLGQMSNLHVGRNTQLFLLRVPSAEDFEKSFLRPVLSKAASYKTTDKASVRLSDETRGITWVALDAIDRAMATVPKAIQQDYMLPVRSRALGQIYLRPYVVGERAGNKYIASAGGRNLMKQFNYTGVHWK
jgi:8-oxo-dGTP pyrophosphatase MutT (NUDIX family)